MSFLSVLALYYLIKNILDVSLFHCYEMAVLLIAYCHFSILFNLKSIKSFNKLSSSYYSDYANVITKFQLSTNLKKKAIII